MKKLYCFDFDGTITKKDTMFVFLKFYNAKKFYISFIKHLPLFVILKLGLADAEKVKMSFISSILKDESEENLDKKALLFFEKFYPQIIREKALDFIQNIDKEKTKCLLVTASLDIWTKYFAKKFGMELVATKAKFKDGSYTGKFASKNCNGKEKVERIKKVISKQKFDKTIAFGDTSGDTEMLNWANEGYYRFFH